MRILSTLQSGQEELYTQWLSSEVTTAANDVDGITRLAALLDAALRLAHVGAVVAMLLDADSADLRSIFTRAEEIILNDLTDPSSDDEPEGGS